MTTTATPHTTTAAPTAEPTPTRFVRVLAAECRKLVSTTPMRVLLLLAVVAVLGIATATAVWHTDLFDPEVLQAPGWPPWIMSAMLIQLALQFLVPPLLILLVTAEWTTRSAMTTFTLEPRRGRVVGAKALVAAAVALVAYGCTTGAGIASTWLGRTGNGIPTDAMWIGAAETAKDLLLWMLVCASAFGLALLLHSGALAIAVALAAPSLVAVLRQFGETFDRIFQWVDLQGVGSTVLHEADHSQVPQLLVAATVWVVLPLVLGAWRTITREAA
ncbi:hypothetical protein [uncultured Tessaracoccus sp.]|uniref:hypothetical protein n=1 Tax=uncultured Tessaracoccus sp. TaxID=905023 RepID=UPI0025EA990E|nr:hypothetical protein [uncultured Tessaracoccus sp.]